MVGSTCTVHLFCYQLASSSKLTIEIYGSKEKFSKWWQTFKVINLFQYSAIDNDGQNIAIAGRTGLAHYSMLTRRWKLFGNETQEKDFIVAGGLLWWHDYIVLGCYSIIDNGDELRFYPKDSKLDNKFAKIVKVSAPILLVNSLQDQLITFGSDAQVSIWVLQKNDACKSYAVLINY